MSMPFYVSPEQLMKDRADFARKGIARGRSVVVVQYADGIALRLREPVAGAAQDQRDLRPHRVRRGRAATTSSRTSASPGSGWPTCAATPTTGATSPAAGWPTPTPRPSARSSPRAARSPTRWRSSSPRSARRPPSDQVYRLTYDGQVADEHGFAVMGGSAEWWRRTSRSTTARACRSPRPSASPSPRSGTASPTPGSSRPRTLEVAVLDRTRTQHRKFRRILGPRLTELLGRARPVHATPRRRPPRTPSRELPPTSPSERRPAPTRRTRSAAAPRRWRTRSPASPAAPRRATRSRRPPADRRPPVARAGQPGRPRSADAPVRGAVWSPTAIRTALRHAVCDQSMGSDRALLTVLHARIHRHRLRRLPTERDRRTLWACQTSSRSAARFG